MKEQVIELCKLLLPVGRDKGSVTQRIGIVYKQRGVIKNNTITEITTCEWLDNTICSAGMALSYGYDHIKRSSTEILAVLSASQLKYGGSDGIPALTKEEAWQFYDILINHTPYGECILTKDPKYAAEFGIIIDPTCPTRIILGATMAQRLAWEQVSIARAILHYVNLGVDKGLAFLIGHSYSANGNSTSNSWHVCVNTNKFSFDYFKNFINNEFEADKPYCEAKTYKYNVDATWGVRRGDEVYRAVAKYAKDYAPALAIPNPFARTLELAVEKQNDKSVAAFFIENFNKIKEGKM